VKRKLANSKNTTSDPSCVDERKSAESLVAAGRRINAFPRRFPALFIAGAHGAALFPSGIHQ